MRTSEWLVARNSQQCVVNSRGLIRARKLSQLSVSVTDGSGQLLGGVLLSVSGDAYRANNVSEDGTLTIIGLTPGEYFVRAVLKGE